MQWYQYAMIAVGLWFLLWVLACVQAAVIRVAKALESFTRDSKVPSTLERIAESLKAIADGSQQNREEHQRATKFNRVIGSAINILLEPVPGSTADRQISDPSPFVTVLKLLEEQLLACATNQDRMLVLMLMGRVILVLRDYSPAEARLIQALEFADLIGLGAEAQREIVNLRRRAMEGRLQAFKR